MSKKALLIDDDPEMGRLIAEILKPADLAVHQAYSGEDGLKLAYAIHPDLVILDVMMPGMDGFDVCQRLREMSSVPILMMTARAYENDLLHGFNVGVDDFLRKPFSRREFEARVNALLRRDGFHKTEKLDFVTSYVDSDLEIDLSSSTVKLHGKPVELSPREYELLACLVRQQGKVVSHHMLAREVWGSQYKISTNLSSLYIFYLRNKLEDGQHGHQYIRTFWGRGYLFAPREQ
ncbi:MAG: DNA-binding response regulator [Anaerolineaceae bacterium]|jgi:DNA-binding response OmpR family regulator|nr:DNA-binding response regulator [Anaerolineae bacterium]MBL1172188.1 DNA-binding response regulator [Chloroflexota bacterium]MBV6466359.1 Transcriptional regulatory protein WalR [Anaerolineales bacterium]MCE7904179.1 DNA-binding response regulator [Anaerolineae bacterium CFX3]MDL1926745.1 response regulator transcription factor [Anaerolineae bacterium AMX1]OQY85716.1 MAG: hypothetical protein B6D40_02735 [Anaerolineae bacterium UTCFX3]GJQ39403.1 MAG: DNA-binding response regulator [Anaeroli